jgi:peptide/nickel transport system permease protein
MHVLLPAFAISLTTVAIYYQVTKSAALDALESDYVKMARAKGLNELEVLVRHVFRSCYLSLSNTFVPNYLYLFNGIVIIELVFGWQGIGIYLMDSIFNYDLNRLMGGVFVLGVFTFFMMLLSDLISNRLDPRIAEFR